MGRRLVVLLAGALALGAPAGILRAACVGKSCQEPPEGPDVPFCSLPAEVRSGVTAGFYDDRSPDVLAVAATAVAGEVPTRGATATSWPEVGSGPARVPVMLAGANVRSEAVVGDTVRLDALAPTIAAVIGLDRPHPEVRSGRAVDVVVPGPPPRLVLQVIWKGIGSADLEGDEGAWPGTRALFSDGMLTLDGSTGSLPTTTAAITTTIGTGGLPRQHGITGTWLRGPDGRVVRAWSEDAPVSVIATLADDLDEQLGQRPLIGVVGTDPTDRGAIGGEWYPQTDRDVVRIEGPKQAARTAREVLRNGFGADATPDLLVVALEGNIADLDAATRRVAAAAAEVSDGALLTIVTATGLGETAPDAIPATDMAAEVEAEAGAGVIEAVVAGGLFLDQATLAARSLSQDVAIEALSSMRVDGSRVLADVFSSTAVAFARYC